jgi:hypothetical protein
VADELDAQGSAVVAKLLSREECVALASLYERDDAFRSRVVMSRHGYGRGEYKVFRVSIAGNDREPARRPLSAARCDGKPLARGDA